MSRMSRMKRAGNEKSGRPGFTLIEIMISLTILAVIFTLIYGTFDSTYRISATMEQRADFYRLARLGVYHLSNDLSMIHGIPAGGAPAPAPAGTGAPPAVLPRNALIFIGEDRSYSLAGDEFPNDRVQFTSVSHGRTMRDAPESDRVLISYYLEEQILIQERQLSNGVTTRNEIGESIQGLNFRYLDPSGRTWVDQWDADQKGKGLRWPLKSKWC